ncbi:MAG: hypothetical protein IJX99_03740 [Clostridia bacterium]|nr:hypothetical protein [Clostridia bacterium]
MSSKSLYPPLKLIRSMELNYPKGFEIYEERLSHKAEDELPFDIASAVSLHFFPDSKYQEAAEVCALLLTVVGEWRKSKQVYSFSKELTDMICDSEEALLDSNIFEYLPYPCFYLEVKDVADIHGVFVKYISDAANHHIIFVVICNDGTFCYNIFDLEGSSTFYTMTKKYADEFEEAKYRDGLRKCILFAFQASVYLCAKNCDVAENPNQQKVYKPSKSIKDKFSEIRKWDVGYRIAKEVKMTSTTPPISAGKSQSGHNRPREHWRKAHWHTYWVGPRGQQRKELRFIAPIHVNDIGDQLPIVNHKNSEK